MTAWATFAGITGVVLVVLLVLSQLTQDAFEGSDPDSDSDSDARQSTVSDRTEAIQTPADSPTPGNLPPSETSSLEADSDASPPGENERPSSHTDADPASGEPADVDPRSLSTMALLANVAFSQGLFALVLLGAVIYTGIPADALGIEFSWRYLEQGLLLGAVFGIALYVANEVAAALATRFGFDHDEELRELLGPDSATEWGVLLVVVLPIIAVFEELLFRAAMIGAMEAGFGVSPWLLAVVSSVAFAVGHGIQGSVGIVVTGALGFVLAAIFVVTGSFLVVVVAHYLINAFEFVVHEGLELEWARILEG
ncbi:type II CAAX endopeptidase family protein [Natronorubrum daqingense]|uniref:Abortive phage infection protein n=1 Tax=Natronorubrum daqingense TaxID=588898 RepID=A0A1N6ZJD1_9EURY|nr:type II CAAX endopeptidase family protein [Natronorubrum daqingense]APX95334.1 abortive phage infection protein [Natronorubrum daqingense]SIR26935.1 Membrane protease YdiL, CAAX protease family [Natronorubrum daqingense]